MESLLRRRCAAAHGLRPHGIAASSPARRKGPANSGIYCSPAYLVCALMDNMRYLWDVIVSVPVQNLAGDRTPGAAGLAIVVELRDRVPAVGPWSV